MTAPSPPDGPSSPPPPGAATGPRRETYRHGDLRRALLEAAIGLARDGGPEAVVLREATRRAGVVPNAAYRHFAGRDDLLLAVRDAALAAMARTMEAALAALPPQPDAGAAARAELRAIGGAYLGFALGERGLFRTAFARPGPGPAAIGPAGAGSGGLDPFQLLGRALDHLAAAGLLPPERRADAEYLAWSAVHGFAMLVIEGPLHELPPEAVAAVGGKLVTLVERGL